VGGGCETGGRVEGWEEVAGCVEGWVGVGLRGGWVQVVRWAGVGGGVCKAYLPRPRLQPYNNTPQPCKHARACRRGRRLRLPAGAPP
jgi:hypothetical protein